MKYRLGSCESLIEADARTLAETDTDNVATRGGESNSRGRRKGLMYIEIGKEEPTCFDDAAAASNVEPRGDEGDIGEIEDLGAVG